MSQEGSPAPLIQKPPAGPVSMPQPVTENSENPGLIHSESTLNRSVFFTSIASPYIIAPYLQSLNFKTGDHSMHSRAAFAWFVASLGLHLSESIKLPSWRGPDIFFGGTLPDARSQHGIASCYDKIYIFGGGGQNGEMFRGR
jgi:hypothetical protein